MRGRVTAFGVAAAALILGATACGGGGASSSSGNPSSGVLGTTHSLATHGKRGGTITVLSVGDVDHIDPGEAYYQFTFGITYVTQRPLLAFKPNSVQPVPDLATSMPTVSKDGKTVTVKI